MPATQKRKKTADMPDSPPKRVTRARAKASDDPASKAKTVKVMTPSVKAATKKDQPAEAPRITKRKTRADDEQQTNAAEKSVVEELVKTRGRAKKVEEKIAEQGVADEVPKKARGRPGKTAEAEEMLSTAPKTRGRPKKVGAAEESKLPIPSEPGKPAPAKITTRTRAAIAKSTAASKAPAKSATIKSAALKKKVTFQDEAEKDKENVPIEVEKPATKATGLRAKPIRKPAATKAVTRSEKAGPAKTQTQADPEGEGVQPLSPKKVVQVAKSSSISSEDELCSSKTPMRALSQSPVKPPPSSARPLDRSVSKLDFGAIAEASSPTRSAAPSVLQSPARRPPPSPFKDAMKLSPKKVNLGDATHRPAMLFPKVAVKSTMKESPKRGVVPVSLAQPVFLARSPTKSSLLQSPARRPGVTPMNAFAQQSPTKSGVPKASMKTLVSPERNDTLKTLVSSSKEAASSPLRATRSLLSPVKVHKMTEADRVASVQTNSAELVSRGALDVFNEIEIIRSVTSPTRNTEEDAQDFEARDERRSPTPSPFKEHRSTPAIENFAKGSMTKESGIERPDDRSATPPGPFPFVAPAFSLASPAFRCAIDESDSEDELASPQKVFLTTPLKKHGISTHDFGAPSTATSAVSDRRSSLRRTTQRQSLAMTPLALQMSTWLASSPEKKELSDMAQIGQRMISPNHSTFEESPARTSFFEDQMAVCDVTNDTVVDMEMGEVEAGEIAVEANKESHSFEEYGDENAVPEEPQFVAMQQPTQDQTMTCTPAKVFYAQPREIHTVSKVPLRPAGDESPLRLPRKRSRSIAGPLASGDALRVASAPAVGVEPSQFQDRTPTKRQGQSKPTSPVKPRSSNDDSLIETPRTLRKEGSSKVLSGAVVYVDVHTSEGEDASGIFLELLTLMGARCVKQWSWNPRASMAVLADDENSPRASEVSNSKVGITHVVFKDGGKRTMEKVRESRGTVACVGVGWVLE